MITKYDAPKKVSLKDFVYNKYIIRFELGDYDRWVNAVVVDIEVPIQYAKHYRKDLGVFKKGDYSICLKTTFKLARDIETLGYQKAKENSCYSTRLIKVRSLKDIENYPIEVIGEFNFTE